MNICTLNNISSTGLDRMNKNVFQVTEEMDNAAGVMVRSASMHDMALPESLLAIARAGAGVNNIPVEACSEKGIVVFNTPGANANAVKELVLGSMLAGSRNLVAASAWAQGLKGKEGIDKLAEKGKAQFVGPEISGKKLGVIGLGAIGVLVANAAASLGMEVYGYDPFLSVDGAWKLSRKIRHCVNLADLYAQCDYLTLHIPATPDTTGMLNKAAFDQMKHGVRILNFARGELVVNADILAAIKSGKVAAFYSDFAAEEFLGVEGITVTPHLGASTPESEENCAVMAADELQDYLLNGNIRNSVNLPNVCIPRSGCARICVIHKNSPGVIGHLSSTAGDAGLNIDNMVNKSKKDYAYTMLDVEAAPSPDVVEKLSALEGVIRVRVL